LWRPGHECFNGDFVSFYLIEEMLGMIVHRDLSEMLQDGLEPDGTRLALLPNAFRRVFHYISLQDVDRLR
jgi:hypothetical protein